MRSSASGTPQGAVISPLVANIYLHPLDVLMQQQGVEMVLYADDELQLHPEKTRLVEMNQPGEGFDFLGYRFHHGGIRWPRPKSEKKLRDKLRPLTKRTNGESLAAIIHKLNRILRGRYGYFRHASRGSRLKTMDGWVRGRLRSILRKRCGRRGRGRGKVSLTIGRPLQCPPAHSQPTPDWLRPRIGRANATS